VAAALTREAQARRDVSAAPSCEAEITALQEPAQSAFLSRIAAPTKKLFI
jgi:hypothetical protein